MRQEITAAMARWHDGAHVDLVDEMFTLTTTIALRALFSSQLDPARAEHLRRAFDTFLRGIYIRAVLPLAGRLPEILQAVQAETDTVLGGDIAGWDHLPRLDLTARVVREALRLYPPAWVLPRTCTRPVTLAGQTLPAGSMVVFSPYILHRRADQYPQPTRFDPARWLTPAPEHRASYLPFGAGATRCIGEEFGLAEATLILATTAARWNLIPDPGTRVSPTARAVLVPRAFPVHLSSRSAP
jgi:pentalenene oxygenase